MSDWREDRKRDDEMDRREKTSCGFLLALPVSLRCSLWPTSNVVYTGLVIT